MYSRAVCTGCVADETDGGSPRRRSAPTLHLVAGAVCTLQNSLVLPSADVALDDASCSMLMLGAHCVQSRAAGVVVSIFGRDRALQQVLVPEHTSCISRDLSLPSSRLHHQGTSNITPRTRLRPNSLTRPPGDTTSAPPISACGDPGSCGRA